jgi:hypothetical protein
MDSLPDFEAIHSRKTSAEVSTMLNEFLAGGETEQEVEASSKETTKFGDNTGNAGRTAPRFKDDIDSAFADLMN